MVPMEPGRGGDYEMFVLIIEDCIEFLSLNLPEMIW